MIRTVIPVTNYWENTRDNFNINKIGLKEWTTFLLHSFWPSFHIGQSIEYNETKHWMVMSSLNFAIIPS